MDDAGLAVDQSEALIGKNSDFEREEKRFTGAPAASLDRDGVAPDIDLRAGRGHPFSGLQ